MDKKIGNRLRGNTLHGNTLRGNTLRSKILLASLFSCMLSCYDQSVRFYLQDMEQNSIRQAEVAVPFIVQVVVDNVGIVEYPDDIPGFDKFAVEKQGSSHSTTSINGVSTQRTMFNYVLRGDKKGVYKLGPLTVKDKNNKTVTSDALHFHVGDKVVAHNLKKQPYFLQVEPDQRSVYFGQKINLSVRFYYVDTFDGMKIVHPEFEDFNVESVSGDPTDGQEITRGVEYRYKEWNMSVYPEKIGTHIIPAMQAVFSAASSQRHGFSGIFDMFGISSERTVQSSARSIEVRSLPESKEFKDVSAVGQFENATFSLQKQTGDIGQGVVATCTIKGIGNIGVMKAPILHLPDGLKYYEANSSVKKIDNQMYEKIFEYIIQGERTGEFEIPSQRFIYFDPKVKSYKTLKTKKTTLEIVGDVAVQEDVRKKIDAAKDHKKLARKYEFKENEISFIHQSDATSESEGDTLLHFLFAWLLRLLISLSLIAGLYWTYLNFVTFEFLNNYWITYVLMRGAAIKAYRQNDVHALYVVFRKLCKQYGFDFQGQDLERSIEQYSKQNVQDWNLFVKEIMFVLFSGQNSSSAERKKVLDKGMFWMKELLSSFRLIQKEKSRVIAKKY